VTRTGRLGLVAASGAVVVVATAWVIPQRSVAVLALLATAVALGEALVIRVPDRPPLPLASAVLIGALRLPPHELAIVVGVGLVVHAAVDDGPARSRARRVVQRMLAMLVAWIVFWCACRWGRSLPDDAKTLVALGAGGIVLLALDEWLRAGVASWRVPWRERAAELALLTSGLFLGIGYDGVGADARLGAWSLPLFAVPLLATWFAFQRLASIRLTYAQTMTALSTVPEIAGLARPGHAQRVAALCDELAAETGLVRTARGQLVAAALLHHVGHLCLPDPRETGRAAQPREVAAKGAEILRQTGPLRPAGEILAPDAGGLAAEILRVASAFDELTAGDDALGPMAVEALRSGPGYFYDPAVLDALARVVRRRELRGRRAEPQLRG